LAGDESGEHSAWVLVKREAGVADRADGSDRWSLDHLFLDHAGVPTLVEVKRSSDTRARREVVAQMLDYAANATAHWNVESLRTWFEAECLRRGVDPEARLAEVDATDVDAYWEGVKTNLAADRIRLVFVADVIPRELRSIIEFLNRQMSETEVYGIEVKHYVDADGARQTIVPRIIGQTEAAQAAKSGGRRPSGEWNEERLLDVIAAGVHGEEAAAVARSVIDWAKTREGLTIRYGRGVHHGTARVKLDDQRATLTAFYINTDGTISIPWAYLAEKPPFDSPEMRDDLRRRINNAAPAAALPPEEERGYPSFDLTALSSEEDRNGFCEAWDWAFAEAHRAQWAMWLRRRRR
jgi:hypothetical protein